MMLRHDPYSVFRSSKTPAGLYARQKWLAEAGNETWQADFQETVDGLRAGQLPFYQTLNALAHLDTPSADQQLERAFDRLAADQNEDGSWGRVDPEWNTFLAVHALRNKGHL